MQQTFPSMKSNMKSKHSILRLSLALTFAIYLGGCASFFESAAFKEIDKDSDKTLTFNEFASELSADPDYQAEARAAGVEISEYLRTDFDQADKDANKLLSLDEFKKFVNHKSSTAK